MKLIVGLGNPGLEYAGTRHNAGFAVVDRLAARIAPGAAPRSRFSGLAVEAQVGDEKCLLLKPTTFMNLSGRSVLEAVQFFKLEPSKDLLVIVDDIALPCGSIRLRPDGSSGGHNGLADIGLKLGSNYWARLRVGVDAPGRVRQVDYVLGRFTPEQAPLVEQSIVEAADAAQTWATRGLEEAMNRFNRKAAAGNGA
ncbi:MAG: aminoacyl-tRNA hydrolase [Phycisphaerales bacterium]